MPAACAISASARPRQQTSPRRRRKPSRPCTAWAAASGRGRIDDHLLGNTKKALASETQLSTYGIGRELSAGVGVISSISFCSKEGRDHGRYRNNKRTTATP
jgi:hypothetical protein